MARSHALAGAAIGIALIATAAPQLTLPAAACATVVAFAIPGRWLPAGGTRVAIALGACLIAARVVVGPPIPAAQGLPGSLAGAEASTRVSESTPDATVEAVTRRAGGRQASLLRLPDSTLVYARLPRYPELVPGDRVAIEGRLEPLPVEPDPDIAGWVGYLRRSGVAATLEASTVRVAGRGDDPAARLAQLRGTAGDLLAAALPEPQAGLAAGILVGLRERVDPGLARDFTAAGLTHVVAISGWNIAIVAGTCGALARRLSRRRRSLVIAAVVATYTLFAGASPSVVRAALMAGVALLAREGGRRAGASRALALAVALMLLVDPATVLDPGFQLSAAATGGLVAWAGPLGGWIERVAPRIPGTVRESLAVSLSAQFATLPIVLLDFGRLSLVSPVANLAAAPLVPFVMAAAAFALPLGVLLGAGVPPIAVSVPLAFASLPLALLVAIARAAAAVPYASLQLPPTVALSGAALAALLVLAAARAGRRARPRTVERPSRA